MSEAQNDAAGQEQNLPQGEEQEVKDESQVNAEDENQSEENSDEQSSDESEESKKKPSGIQRRFQKFQSKLDQQAQELEYWKKVAIEAGQGKKTEAPAAASTPKLADFDNVEDYIDAREEFLKQELIEKITAEAKAKAQQETIYSQYDARVDAAKSEITDWDEVMQEAAEEPTAPETFRFCLQSEVGPKIAYHLAKNPDVHDRLNSLSPERRLAELGKIEDRLMTSKEAAPTKKVTKAPEKMSNVKGTADSQKSLAASTGEARSYSEWKAIRERQKAKR